VNAAVIKASYRISTGIDREINDIPCLVNGDDGLVRAPDTFGDIWKDIAKSVGLIPSVGKVYTHAKYANINSTSYLFENGRFNIIRYPNMGLVVGNVRSSVGGKGKTDLTTVFLDSNLSIGAKHHALIDLSPERLRNKVHSLFLKYNSKF